MDETRKLLKQAGKDRAKAKFLDQTAELRYILKGLEILVEATAAAITSIYAIYSAQHNHMSVWAAWALTVAGAVVVLRAFIEYIRLLNRRG